MGSRLFIKFYSLIVLVILLLGAGVYALTCPVRGIVAHYGGRIWVEPSAGGGSIFRFTLPAGPADHS